MRATQHPAGQFLRSAWVPVVAIPVLVLSVLLMHGFGFGHHAHAEPLSPPAIAVEGTAVVTAHQHDGDLAQAHDGHMAQADRGPVTLAAGPSGAGQDGPGHGVSPVDVCLAILAILFLVLRPVLVGRGAWRRRVLRDGGTATAWVVADAPRVRPARHVLCVMRT